MSGTERNLVELKNVHLSYSSREILAGVDLTLRRGDLVSIVGKSGSGKSTLLYILGGFLKPARGEYNFDGKAVYKVGELGLGRFRKTNIGFVFQDFRLLPFLTVEQNIRFPLLFTGRDVKSAHATDLLEKLGIAGRRKARPRDISGGEAQRTAIGRALVLGPRLLLLDEPTGNLDEKTEEEILELLMQFKERGLALVCVTHSPRIMEMSDAVWHLEDGKLSVHKASPSLPRAKARGKEKREGAETTKPSAKRKSAKKRTTKATSPKKVKK